MSSPAASRDWISLKEYPTKTGRPYVISVSKRVIRLSTARSRVKRLIREAMRLEGHKPPEGREWKWIVNAPLPQRTKSQEVRSLLNKLISQASGL